MITAKFRLKEVLLIVFCILFTTILYYRDFTATDFNKIYLVVMVSVTAMILDYKHIIYLLCFLFPLSCGIPGNYIYPLLCLLLVAKDKEFSVRKLMFFVVIFFCEIAHYAFYDFDVRVAEVIGYSSFLFMLSYLVGDRSDDVDYAKCLTYFSIGVAIVLLAIVINTELMMSQIMISPMNENIRLGDTTAFEDIEVERMKFSLNANTIGYYSIAAISCLLVLQYYKKINPILFLSIFAISFYGGVLSISRTWIMLMVVSIIVYLGLQQRDRFRGLLLIGILVIGVICFLSKNAELLDLFIARFTDDTKNIETAGGRTIIFSKYNEYLADNPISLIAGTGAVYYRNVTQMYESTHNAIQQIVVSYGLLGLGLFLYAFINSAKKYGSKKELVTWLPICMTVLFVQTIQILNPYSLMCPIIVAFFALKLGSIQNKISYK